MGPETFRPSDLDTLWQALEDFHATFSHADWLRPHGPDWRFLDVPSHLTVYNQMLLDAIQQPPDTVPPAVETQQQQDDWNARRFARRLLHQTPEETLQQFSASQIELRHRAVNLAAPVYLPILYASGWRTVEFALEFIFYHSWLHFTEAHLRRDGWMPGLQDRITHVALNFQMEVHAVAVNAAIARRLGDFTWWQVITDSAGGEWTFTLHDGVCRVKEGTEGQPALTLEHSLLDYARGTLFGLGRAVPLLSSGKARQIAALFTPPAAQPIPPLERGTASPVV